MNRVAKKKNNNVRLVSKAVRVVRIKAPNIDKNSELNVHKEVKSSKENKPG